MQIERQGKSGCFTLRLDTEMELPQKYWRGFLDELKAMIDWGDRDYDLKTQTWTIRDTHYQAVVDLKKKHFERDQMSMF